MSDSYTSYNQGIVDNFRQLTFLSRRYSRDIESVVSKGISEMKQAETRIGDHYKVRLANLEILEVGPGQFFGQMPYLSRNNRIKAADRDIIAQGLHPAAYMQMLINNGIIRTFKTVGRKVLGVDRRYRKVLCRNIGMRSFPSFEIKQASADKLPFADRSFDLVYSRAVFQHLPSPANAIREIHRVLRPGGLAYISLQPYTSPTACLDPRVHYGSIDNELGLWPHLRPELRDGLKPNAYVNRLGLRDWQILFARESADPIFFVTPVDGKYFPLAAELKRAGHLQAYTIEELTAGAIDVMFRNA